MGLWYKGVVYTAFKTNQNVIGMPWWCLTQSHFPPFHGYKVTKKMPSQCKLSQVSLPDSGHGTQRDAGASRFLSEGGQCCSTSMRFRHRDHCWSKTSSVSSQPEMAVASCYLPGVCPNLRQFWTLQMWLFLYIPIIKFSSIYKAPQQ